MYQALHTRTHNLILPAHTGTGGPITAYLPIAVTRAGSILRVAIESENDRDVSIDLLTGSSEVDADAFPLADDAYFILSCDMVAGKHYSMYNLGQALYATLPNLKSQLNTTIWAKVTFDSDDPIAADTIKFKLDSAICLSM